MRGVETRYLESCINDNSRDWICLVNLDYLDTAGKLLIKQSQIH